MWNSPTFPHKLLHGPTDLLVREAPRVFDQSALVLQFLRLLAPCAENFQSPQPLRLQMENVLLVSEYLASPPLSPGVPVF